MPASKTEDGLAKAWNKITGQESHIGRAGYIPVWDGGEWRLFRNTFTIYELAENCADPVKVEVLRRNAADLVEKYPDTVKKLEALGIRVKRVLASPIKTPADVAAWTESIFNTGPVTEPERITHTQALAYDDFTMKVQAKPAVYVVPAGPRGSGVNSVIEVSVLGKARKLGPRSPFTKTAFEHQDGVTEGPISRNGKPLGRPRSDGLTPGSPEAKAADLEKKRLYQASRRKALRETDGATVTPIEDAPKTRRLVRRPTRSA
jgi:hypothetical protein